MGFCLSTQRQEGSYVHQNKDHKKTFFNSSDLVYLKEQISKDYSIMQPPLGQGTFGVVYKAIHLMTQTVRAVKVIKKKSHTQEEDKTIINEMEILRNLDHPNIVKIHDIFQEKKHFYIVSEFCEGGELFDYLIEHEKISEFNTALVIKQVLSAVAYCHKHKIVHRDLKPENLLLRKNSNLNEIKLIDFGTSVWLSNKKLSKRQGTIFYMAPEVIEGTYNEKCDLWSLGVILHIMLVGYPPFQGDNDSDVFKKIALGKFSNHGPLWNNISSQAQDLLSKLLVLDVGKRYSAEEALAHPWFDILNQDSQKTDKSNELDQALKNLKNYRQDSKIQQAIYFLMVENFADEYTKKKLLNCFRQLDVNGDGLLSKEELIQAYSNIEDFGIDEQNLDQIMKNIDNNDNGYLDYSEFVLAAIDRKELLSKQNMRNIFKLLDKVTQQRQDGSGQIDMWEFKQIFGNAQIDEQTWDFMINEIGEDIQNSQISFDIFKQIMIKIMKMENTWKSDTL